jgi:hypothetical protein
MKSLVRAALWHAVFAPAIRAYFLAAYGDSSGGIHTPNLIGIAQAP